MYTHEAMYHDRCRQHLISYVHKVGWRVRVVGARCVGHHIYS